MTARVLETAKFNLEPFISPYFGVAPLPGMPILRIVRSERAFTSVEELTQGCEDLSRALDRMGRSRFVLLIDTRAVAGRNDLAFEQAFARHRIELVRGFSRIAVVVATSAGRLQVQRHAATDGVRMRAFLDESEAIEWLSERPRGTAR
jgi:hypothetical protein